VTAHDNRSSDGSLTCTNMATSHRSSRVQNRVGRSYSDIPQFVLYNDIGLGGTSAAEVQDWLRENAGARQLEVRINSRGGDAVEGLAIYAALKLHPAHVTVYVDGVAASIASAIAMAGDRIVMGRGTQLMMHEVTAEFAGGPDAMANAARLIGEDAVKIAAVYAARAGGTVPEWRQRMRAETWYSAEQAVLAGLADEAESGSARRSPQLVNHAQQGRSPAGGIWQLIDNLTDL